MPKQDYGFVWTTVEFKNDLLEPLRLKLRKISPEEGDRRNREAAKCRNSRELLLKNIHWICELAVDWNLKEDGKRIPCNEQNISKYLPKVLSFPIKNVEISQPGKVKNDPIFQLMDKSDRLH